MQSRIQDDMVFRIGGGNNTRAEEQGHFAGSYVFSAWSFSGQSDRPARRAFECGLGLASSLSWAVSVPFVGLDLLVGPEDGAGFQSVFVGQSGMIAGGAVFSVSRALLCICYASLFEQLRSLEGASLVAYGAGVARRGCGARGAPADQLFAPR